MTLRCRGFQASRSPHQRRICPSAPCPVRPDRLPSSRTWSAPHATQAVPVPDSFSTQSASAGLGLDPTMTGEIMDKDRIAGSAKQVKGALKQAAGKVVGDTKLESEGQADKVEGKIQNAIGSLGHAQREIEIAAGCDLLRVEPLYSVWERQRDRMFWHEQYGPDYRFKRLLSSSIAAPSTLKAQALFGVPNEHFLHHRRRGRHCPSCRLSRITSLSEQFEATSTAADAAG